MSASDPVKSGLGPRGAIRVVQPPDDGPPGSRRDPIAALRCSYRPAGADFYCWKFGVWYALMDCCYRHDEQTYDGCVDCGQGSSNLKQNRDRYRAHQGTGRSRYGP